MRSAVRAKIASAAQIGSEGDPVRHLRDAVATPLLDADRGRKYGENQTGDERKGPGAEARRHAETKLPPANHENDAEQKQKRATNLAAPSESATGSRVFRFGCLGLPDF